VAGGESRRILQWNAVTGEPVGTPLTGPRAWIMRLAFRGTRLIGPRKRRFRAAGWARKPWRVRPNPREVPSQSLQTEDIRPKTRLVAGRRLKTCAVFSFGRLVHV
jgi:hypothetical protein